MATPYAGMRFCGCPIDRAAALTTRKSAATVQNIASGPAARFLLVSAKRVLAVSSPAALAWRSLAEALEVEPQARDRAVYLGPIPGPDKVEAFALAVGDSAAPKEGEAFLGGRELMLSKASDADVATAGYALALTGWHETAVFEGRSGKPTVPVEGGMKRQVEGGGAKVYPRTDPVAIGLILSPDGSKCLLGRGAKYPKGMYTCLSGFVDQCESIEECFKREVMEEAGLQLASVELLASQPWPIGRAGSCELMIGCRAVAATEEFKVNPSEIEDARWFTRKEAREMLAASTLKPYSGDGSLFTPPPLAIAHHLIKQFTHPPQRAQSSSGPSWTHMGMVLIGLAGGLALGKFRGKGFA